MTHKVKKAGMPPNKLRTEKKLKGRGVNRKTHVLFSAEEAVVSVPFNEGNSTGNSKAIQVQFRDPGKELSIPQSAPPSMKSIQVVETDAERSWSTFRHRMRQKGYNF